jgi:hypothetical protein
MLVELKGGSAEERWTSLSSSSGLPGSTRRGAETQHAAVAGCGRVRN